MKKLFFLILFFNITILTFGANVYFLNDGSGYIYTNAQTFYSDASGRALVHYHLWADPSRYIVNEYGARFQDPFGNWTGWSQLSTSQGLHQCTKAGTWYIEGRAHVQYDIYGYSNYWMYTNVLYFYVVDNYAPAVPSNFSGNSSGEHPVITWSANTEYDFDYYEIWKKGGAEGGDWHLKTTTTNTNYEDSGEEIVTGPAQAFEGKAYYKVKAIDINSNSSTFTNQIEFRISTEPLSKKGNLKNDFIPPQYLLEQNYPNPFNPSTKISWQSPEAGQQILKIYDALGNEVAALVNEWRDAGWYSVEFNAENLPNGIYIYQLNVNDFVSSKKLILLK